MKNCLFVLIVALIGYQSGNRINTSALEIMEQIDTIRGGHEDNCYYLASFCIDVPVNGPQELVDSVMAFVNREIYKMCEYCIEFNGVPDEYVAYSEKEIYINDGKHLLSHYLEKYKTLIEDSIWNTFGLELKMEAQTEKYVTFGVERLYCGASCSSEKYYYTFDKNNGHQVKEIISQDNLVRFFKDYPEYNSIDDDSWFGWA